MESESADYSEVECICVTSDCLTKAMQSTILWSYFGLRGDNCCVFGFQHMSINSADIVDIDIWQIEL